MIIVTVIVIVIAIIRANHCDCHSRIVAHLGRALIFSGLAPRSAGELIITMVNDATYY